MKKILVLLLILVLSLTMLSGCGGTSEEAGGDTSENPSVLNIGVGAQWGGIDNYQVTNTNWSQNMVIECILSLQPDGTYGPGLAKSFSVSEDGSILTLEIPDDLKFADGSAVTPEDVKASIEYGLEVSPYNTDYEAIQSVDVDGQNVICHMSGYSPSTMYDLSSLYMPVIPKAQLESMSQEELLWGATPYGAYYLASPEDFVEGSSVKLTKNPYYKTYNPLAENASGPDFDIVNVQFFENESALLNSVNAGETDLTFDLPVYMIPELTEDANCSFTIDQYYTSVWLQMNADDPIFSDENVRKAFMLLTDRSVIEEAAGGLVSASYELLPANCIDYSSAASDYFKENYDSDPEEALSLLAGSGWEDSDGDGILDKDGQPLTIKVLTPSGLDMLTSLLQVIWGGAGVNVEMEEMTSTEPFENDSYQIAIVSMSWPEPSGFLPYIIYDPNLLDEEGLTAYMTAIGTAAANTNDAERAEGYAEAQKILLDSTCEIPVGTVNVATVVSNNLEGGYFGAMGRRYIQDIHFAE